MPGPDHKPTPMSGTPAAVAATSAARPSGDEITAPKSEATVVILEAIERVRGEVITRVETLEREHGKWLRDLTEELTKHRKQISELAEAQVTTARAASTAADLSAQAIVKANSSQDDARKMVESAMAIQKGAIEAAVAQAVDPILKDAERTTEALGAVVDELGIEDRVELGRKVPPGEKPPETALKKIDKRAKHSTLVQLVIAIGVIVNAIWQLASSHH